MQAAELQRLAPQLDESARKRHTGAHAIPALPDPTDAA